MNSSAFIRLGFFLTVLHFGLVLPAQTDNNPISYNNVRWNSHVAEFSFDEEPDRKIVKRKRMTFFAKDKIEVRFRILVEPNGEVSYVCAPGCPAQLREYQRGGSSALYGYQFSEVPEAAGPEWMEVSMVVGE